MTPMDEQRIEAYLELIQALLSCPEGQEGAVLQDNAELVDAGLVQVMGLVAQQMEEAGEGNAGWLRQFAGQLVQALSSASAGEVSQDTLRFVGQVMRQILQVQGDPMQVYEFWRANLARFNEDFLAVLPVVFQRLKTHNSPEIIAAVFNSFGNLIQQFPLGVRKLNLELAITAYERALEVRTRDAFPEQWATTQNNLANAYSDRIRGERADNLEHDAKQPG
ncbi:tetratricopeptide repeat protein [Sodalinema gerasimenkoae]|uniref:tetratricopeptide repeat protein n=1 Tax=Sodalinema gerasimenkoae TaxID=2862348 RepID=UPI0013598B2F|nr:tetratricopeptide repeat protein [Sodalinema gerasimenkoae]